MRKVSYTIYTEDGRFYTETTNYEYMARLADEGYIVATCLKEVPELSYWKDGDEIAFTYAERKRLKHPTFHLTSSLVTALQI